MRVISLVSLASAAALGLFASPASALTISNADADPHTVTVTAGADSKEVTVAPDQQVDAGCADGCKVKLENGEEYDLKGPEQVSIEGGVMFVDHSPDADDEDVPDIDPDAEAAAPGDAAPSDQSATSAVPQAR